MFKTQELEFSGATGKPSRLPPMEDSGFGQTSFALTRVTRSTGRLNSD